MQVPDGGACTQLSKFDNTVLMENPLSTRALILTSLLGGEKFGLEIIDSVRDASGIELNAGALYPALHALVSEKLLRCHESVPLAPRGGRRRQYYELTAKGRLAARASVDSMKAVLTLAEAQ